MNLRRFANTGYVFGLVLGLGLIITYGFMEVSSTPRFCGSCHVMAPYYESWETSSHANIACVDCHIPPGITAEFRKKYEALAMVARYFTGTYGTNPWAEIDDAACLECHERRLLMGKEVFGDVLFDHGPHFAELRRGKRLRCTSCHSQIVQGSHITVTSSSCVICHFKGQQPGANTAQCTLCHQIPSRIVDADGIRFDHSDVERFGMACESCHTPARADEGAVPRERCFTCHNDPERLAEYENGDLLHRAHVTDHKVECTHCHLEIQHVAPRHLETARTECATCHGKGHSPQRSLYAGIGGKGVEPMPDVMYRAGVRCEGCHLTHDGEDTRRAGEISCMSCHGPSYRQLFLSWTQTVHERTSQVRRQIEMSERALGSDPPAEFLDARNNLLLVERGRGIHNVPYSLAVLEASHRQLNAAREAQGLSRLETPWPTAPYASSCLDCHAGVETSATRAFGRSFPHQPHVVSRQMECETCHSTHEQRETEGLAPLLFNAEGCSSCHHGRTAGTCSDCHNKDLQRSMATELGDFDHVFHIEEMGLDCAGCHGQAPAFTKPQLEVCSECH